MRLPGAFLEGRLISVLKTVIANHLQTLPGDTCSVCIFKMATQFIRFAGCSKVQFFGSEQRLASLGIGKCAHRGFIVKWVQECGRS